MKVLKCDRCGRSFNYDEDMANYVSIGYKNAENGHVDIGWEYNLCPECINIYSTIEGIKEPPF